MKNHVLTLLLILLIGVSSGQDTTEYDSLMAGITNSNIDFVTYRPDDAKTILLERRIEVVGPPQAIELLSLCKKNGSKPLLKYFDDKNKDWAVHVILSVLFEIDPNYLLYQGKSIERWRGIMKSKDYKLWIEKIGI